MNCMKTKVNFTPFILLGILILSIAGYFFFGSRYNLQKSDFTFIGFFISSFLAIELLIFHLVPPFSALMLFLISRNKDFLNGFWFKEYSWEKGFYKFIKVKRWKTRIGTYDKNLFSSKNFSKEKLLMTITQSELVHEIIFVLSFLPLYFMKDFGHTFLLAVLCTVFALLNLPFVFIQRYNRPRIISFKSKIEKS